MAARNRGEWRPAAALPVARVAVDVPLAHLDRPFDYAVPEHLDGVAGVGVRVRVRFAGRLVDGFVLERVAASDHTGRLAWVEKVVSSECALPPEIAALCRAVADRYGGVLADVLRLAVPPRHARVEGEAARAASPAPTPAPPPTALREAALSTAVVAAHVTAHDSPDAAACAAESATPGERERAAACEGVRVAVGDGERAAAGEGERPTASGGERATGRVAEHEAILGATGGAPRASEVAQSDARAADTGTAGPEAAGSGGWGRYPRGRAFLRALGERRAAHAVWQALPGEDWAARLAEAALTTLRAGRGALLVVPDQRDVDFLIAACAARLGPDEVVALTADLGPAERYRRWLAVRRGQVRVVVGTRSAAFAPVVEPGLLAVWDDGDDLHAEPRAPYPHVRDVLVLRAHAVGAALLVGGFARTAEGQLLVESRWASEIVADRTTVRAAMPRVVAQGESDIQLARDPLARAARLPSAAFEAARAALGAGRPVLVQAPRGGYVPWLSCASCRETARCRQCAGPLGVPGRDTQSPDAGAALPTCRWCGRVETAFRCGACGSRRLRAGIVGSRRTAEELGRAFPGVPVRTSGGGAPVLPTVADRPEIVVATPGAEPRVAGGYGAALLLDGWALLARPDLRVAEESLRRWMVAAAAVVPHSDGGRVLVMADPALPSVQALVRWDPVGHAAAELAARAEVGFPPAVRMAAVEGSPDVLKDLLDGLVTDLAGVEVLGPVEMDDTDGRPTAEGTPGEERERALVRVPRADGKALAAALHAAQAARSARKATGSVRVRIDPPDIG